MENTISDQKTVRISMVKYDFNDYQYDAQRDHPGWRNLPS